VRIIALLLTLSLSLPLAAWSQVSDPGAQQDAEAAREKLLNAADQLDNIQANSETTKVAVDGMKNDVAKLQSDVTQLQTDNAALKQQIVDLQAALAKSEADRIKDRQTLIDNVADMMAAGKGTPKKKKDDSAPAPTTQNSTPVNNSNPPSIAPGLAPPPDPNSAPTHVSTSDSSPDNISPQPKPQKGYYHIVADGETLTLICEAYRDNGVKVTVAEIRKANGLTEKSVLKTGQKIFIPKPGT
jgi:TolA-binding protein